MNGHEELLKKIGIKRTQVRTPTRHLYSQQQQQQGKLTVMKQVRQ